MIESLSEDDVMAHRAEIDVAALPELRRLAEEVRDTQEPVLLRAENEELAVLMPLAPATEPRRAPSRRRNTTLSCRQRVRGVG